MSKDQVGIKRKANEIVDYSSLENYFGSKINKTEPQNPEAPQGKKTPNKECETPSLPSNSISPRDQSPSRLSAVVTNLKL